MSELKIRAQGLLLNPSELLKSNPFLQVLQVHHNNKKVEFKKFHLDKKHIDIFFKDLEEEGKVFLSLFHTDARDMEVSEIKKRRNKQKSGIAEDVFVKRALLRFYHKNICNALPYFKQLKLYHRKKDKTSGNYAITACSFRDTRPEIHFNAMRKHASFGLEVFIQLEDRVFPLHDFDRYQFLIEKDNEYFLLSPSDLAILDWLSQKTTQQYFKNEDTFLQYIVRKLESDYKVNKNHLFRRTKIISKPDKAVYLSEISGSMIMFTPWFYYEGIKIESEWKAEHEIMKNGELFLVHRDQEEENALLIYLKSLHPQFSKQSGKFFYLSFEEAKKKNWFLKTFHKLLEDDIELMGLEFLRHFRYSLHPPVTKIKMDKAADDSIRYTFEVYFDKEKIKLKDLQKILLSGQHSILLKDNTIAVLSEEWLHLYGLLLKHAQITGDRITVPRWLLLGLDDTRDTLEPVTPTAWHNKWTRWQKEEAVIYEKPDIVQASLRPYQQKGFEWLVLLSEINAGACLADDMGLGKTLQTLCFLAYQKKVHPNAKFIIVTPASLIHNWEKEIERFTPTIKPYVLSGVNRNIGLFIKGNADILICSFGTLRADIARLQLNHWNTVVIDESHNIKNFYAQTTKAVYLLEAHNKIALTGTPVVNNTFDLYAQMHFLLPNLFQGPQFFRKEYAHPIDHNKDKEKLKALNELTAPFILRRAKSQVAKDLPDKIESILWCEMEPSQKEVYLDIRDRVSSSLLADIQKKGIKKSKLNILQGITKLRQVCASPVLLKDGGTLCRDSVKIDVLLEELKRLKDQKSLVFSQFTGMLRLIADKLEEEEIEYLHFDGSTPPSERTKLVERFQEADSPFKVFLISLKAGNAGLNLTAAECVFLIDPWWNEAVQQQAIDRTHRIGQKNHVMAYKMICKDTIEEKILNIQNQKKILSEALITEEDGFVKNLTEEEIKYLFQ